MSNQPKPTGEVNRNVLPEGSDGTIRITPKPTGGWTMEWLRQYLSGYSSYDLQLKAIADAHNAALAAAVSESRRSDIAKFLPMVKSEIAAHQPKPTGDWTHEFADSVTDEGVPVHCIYGADGIGIGLATNPNCEGICDAHNAALTEATDAAVQEMLLVKQQLSAERRKREREMADYETLCNGLRHQLSAEREKVTLAKQMVQIESNRANEADKQLAAAQAAKKQAAQFLREGVKPLQVAGYLDTSDTTALDSAIAQQLRDQLAAERGKVRMLVDALEWAFTIIANAGGGDWQRESKEWQDAAAKWRDEAWHPALAKVEK